MRKLKTVRPTLEELTAGMSQTDAKRFRDIYNRKTKSVKDNYYAETHPASGCTLKEYEAFLDNMHDIGLRFESIKYQLPNPASVPLPPPPPPPKKKTPEEMSPPFTMQGVSRKI